ncbi:MAG TPA: alpha-galactosidase [Bryobacteraceae bacterium]|nr:alpha-galactosidase [Bryobacteraceae bacterium]
MRHRLCSRRLAVLAGMAATLAGPAALTAEIQYDNSQQTWKLTTGPVEYRLRQEKQSVRLEYFGPAGMADWKREAPRRGAAYTPSDIAGRVDGQAIAPEELELVAHETGTWKPGTSALALVYRHRRIPLRIEARYVTWGETGVITRRLTLSNAGSETMYVESLPELALLLPPGDYELTYLWGGWGQERQLATEKLGAGRRSIVSSRGRSTSLYSPWFALRNNTLGVRYLAQLAYSGNWQMRFEKTPGSAQTRLGEVELDASLGTLNDFEGALALPAGASRQLPEVAFTASAGDLDDAANQMHRYQRAYVFPRTPNNEPRLVQFNSWYPFPGKMSVEDMKKCADMASEIGAEVFVLDSGWYNKKNWSSELGDYQADPVAFPNGLEELARHVRSRGMKFGIWVEIENLGAESQMFREHPGWCLSYNGQPIRRGVRYMLNFAKPEVRQWAHAVVDRLVRDYQLEWMKIDYNIDIGDEFDPPGRARTGNVLADHIANYYAWLDEVRAAHPQLFIENCSSGGLRFDLGIMGHTHTNWLSDVVEPLPSVQLAYGCTMEFAPEVCNHWMVGDTSRGQVDLSKPAGWWDFMFRVPMNGQYGISSRVFDWNAGMKTRAAENVALYKRLRPIIMGADVYHLTPPPANQDPAGWMVLQYVAPDRKRSVVMAYRLGESGAEELLRLHGLEPGAAYRVSIDGKPGPVMQQQELAAQGLRVTLAEPWRAAAIELQAEQ